MSELTRSSLLKRGAVAAAACAVGTPASDAWAATRPDDRDPWLVAAGGRYRQIFDIPHHFNGSFLPYVRNYLDAYRDAYATPQRDVSALLGLHGTAIAVGLSDGAWRKYDLGRLYQLVDPKSGQVVDSNPFLTGSAFITEDASVGALQRRGMVVLLCHNVLAGLASKLEATGHGSAVEIATDLAQARIHGSFVVPAMVAAFGRAQLAGCSYVVYVA